MGTGAGHEVAARGAQILTALRSALVLLALAALPLACGSEEEQQASPERAIANAATKTAEAGSSRAKFRVSVRGVAPGPITMTGEGTFDSKRRVGRMTLDLSGAGGGASEVETIMDGPVVYMKVPGTEDAQSAVKPWLKVDLRRVASRRGVDFGGLEQVNQVDPSRMLAFLRGVSGRVDEIGEEEVRGVETTHYKLTIDLEKVARETPEQRTALREAIERSGVQRIPAEVWVDDEGFVRRVKLLYENVRVGGERKAEMAVSMDLYDFGVDVDARPPPPNQVTDLEELFGTGES